MLRAGLFVLALSSGAIAAWLVSAMPAQQPIAAPAQQTDVPPKIEQVLVAATAGQQGEKLLPENLRWQPWPAEALHPELITQTARPQAQAELIGSSLRVAVLPGEPIVASKLAPPGTSYLSATLAPGMRAVAVSISAERTAGGFVLPNDRVDVVQAETCSLMEECTGTVTVRTVLRNVRVLAIDQSGSVSDLAAGLLGKTATLELDPAQAETLIGAQAVGSLSLILRSAADHGEVSDTKTEVTDVIRVWRKGAGEYVTVK